LKLNFLSTDSDWIATYYGKGILTLEDKRTIPCAFEVGQLKNGEVFLLCGFPLPPALPAFSPFVPPHKFDGTTMEDFQVSTRGNITIVDFHLDYRPNNHLESWAIYHLNEMMVQLVEGIQADSIRFGITNFLFDEPFALRLEQEGDITMLSIEPIKAYSRVMQRVRILKSIDVTCEVIGNGALDRDTERLEQVVDDLCYLLSVTQGTKIQWIYCDQYDKSGTLILRIHTSRVAKVYSPLSIINKDREVKTFLEKTYSGYVKNLERYKLNLGTIDAYLDAKAENDYLQLRGIKLVVAMEALKDVFLRLPQSPVQEYVSRGGSSRKGRKLERRPFGDILKDIFKKIDLTLEDEERKLFIKCRNSLVHRGRFYQEIATRKEREKYNWLFSDETEYFFLVSVLDKVFLKLLGYSGPYSDWSSPSNPIRRELA
jgi:hypothetical protein